MIKTLFMSSSYTYSFSENDDELNVCSPKSLKATTEKITKKKNP